MKEMTLVEHLTDLKKAAVHCVVILIVAFIGCYIVGDNISEFLLTPLRNALGVEDKITYMGILDKVIAQFQVAFWASIIVSAPLWFREVWLFLKPGLYENEKKTIRVFVGIGFLLFALGVCFGYFIAFPLTFKTLMSWGVENIDATFNLKEYLLLCSKVLVFLGIIFQIPNVIVIMGLMGLIDRDFMNNNRRYIYVGMCIVAAILTPPDVLTMMALWVPLVALYECGTLGMILIVEPYHKRHS